ncbi:MAG TPA: hypothetical protein VNZ66_06485 [Aeromicrobium sp.]|nr:hypothetical protein [Aeromicrobium sp.]
MRWDRLFADLEGAADHAAKVEVETLASELSDELWADTGWRSLLGGVVVLDVRGVGHVTGELAGIHDDLLRLRGSGGDRLIATAAVTEIVSSQRRDDQPPSVRTSLGWGSALRRLRDAGETVRVVTDSGTVVTGRVDAIGRDFVRVAVASGRRRVVVLDALAVVAPGG